MSLKRKLTLIISILLPITGCFAQDYNSLYKEGQKFHKNYLFDKAIAIYNNLIEKDIDSTFKVSVQKGLILSENGKSMLQYAANVEPIEQKITPFNHFFLKYPGFEDKEWIQTPANLLGTDSTVTLYNYMHFPKEATMLAYSAPDTSGVWNIYTITKLTDTTWSAPAILNENITTSGNEVFPYLSADNKRLYFSSNGHSGMGGYDLFYCNWDEELNDWDTPHNLGFPYSSVENDYLYYNTPDGIFTIFASDRITKKESEVTIFSVLYDATPIKQSVEQDKAYGISLLKTQKEKAKESGTSNKKTDSEYAKTSNKIRELRNTLKSADEKLQIRREEYALMTDSIAKIKVAEEITAAELANLEIEAQINTANARLQEIEMQFLADGIILDELPAESPVQSVSITDYELDFADNTLGQAPVLNVMEPEPEVDLNFKILPTAVMASLDDIPKGLVYQVQLCVLSKPATLKALKGMSPVFERKSATGKYTYTAGVFYKYQDVLKALYRIRKNGFPGALINAYIDGEYTLVKKAMALEKEGKYNSSYRVLIGGYDVLPPVALTAIKSVTSKDLAKTTVNGVTEYIIGPFGKKEEAEKLVNALEAENIKGVRIETVTKK